MKKIILAAFTCAAMVTVSAQTSTYYPFPDSDAMWNIHSIYYAGPYSQEMIYSIRLEGDTMISGVVYHKLTVPFVQILPSGPVRLGTAVVPGYQGAIRQEIQDRKVYIMPPGSVDELLLYDFNLRAGDTVKGYIEGGCHRDIVTSIDSVKVGNDYHKRWKIGASMYLDYYIEGVGYNYGLLLQSPCQSVDLPDVTISCFSQNGITLYPDTISVCEVITGTGRQAEPDMMFRVTPNPSAGRFRIEFSQPGRISDVRIQNMNGALVYHFCNHIPADLFISLGEAGMYFLSVTDLDGLTVSQKISVSGR